MSKKKAPLRKPSVDLNKLDQFASEVETKPSPQASHVKKGLKTSYPWEDPKVPS